MRLRDELLNGEIFYTLQEAQIIIESWRPLQLGQTARIAWVQTASSAGVRACIRRVAGCATPTAPPATLAQPPTLKLTSTWTTQRGLIIL